MISHQLTDSLVKSERFNDADLEPESAKRATQSVLDVINLPLEQLAEATRDRDVGSQAS
jgi:hypothetical protein